jgi:hypothetical protein
LAREAARLQSTPLAAPNSAPAALPAISNLQSPAPPQAFGPGSGFDADRLRRYASEIVEGLLAAFSPKAPTLENRVPLVRCDAVVQAGHEGTATVRVANDETSPSEVTLYCTNFVADSGYDIPALRVTCSPRTATIPAKGERTFEIKIAIPQQTPRGVYSGLIQAMGAQYVKAVLTVEVM